MSDDVAQQRRHPFPPTGGTEGGENKEADLKEHVLVVREGHGANCSSIGSVIDTLFASAVVGGVLLTVILAAMKKEAAEEKKE